MANLTNGTLSSGNGTEYSLLLCARALADFLAEHPSLLNVSKDNTYIFTLIMIVKNAIVCLGISDEVSLLVTILLLITLTCYSLVLLAGNYVLDIAIIWASFATVLFFKSDVVPLPRGSLFLLSATTYFRVPCTLGCVLDIFLIVLVGCYILKILLESVGSIIERSFIEVLLMMFFLALDLKMDTKGYIFMIYVIVFLLFPMTLAALSRREMLYFFVFLLLQIYCVYEQCLIYYERFAYITCDTFNITNITSVGANTTSMEANATRTPGSLLLSVSNGTDPQFPATPDFLPEYHSILNVCSNNMVLFTLILILKSAFLCHGICDTFALQLTLTFLIKLIIYSFVLLVRRYVLNSAIILAFILSTVLVRLREIKVTTFIFSVIHLCLAPIHFRIPLPRPLEYIVDIFLTIHVGWYILKVFFVPIEELLERYFLRVYVLLIFVALGIFSDYNCFLFTLTVVLYYILDIFEAYSQREILYLIVMVSSIIYRAYEQYLIHLKRSANITSVEANITNITSMGANMTNTTRT